MDGWAAVTSVPDGQTGVELSEQNPSYRLEAVRKRLAKGETYFVALDLLQVAEAARAFVATTSVFRQPKDSRPEFEALARALIDLELYR
jgi:hypothetical protein